MTWHPLLMVLILFFAVVGSLLLVMTLLSVTSFFDWDERTRPDN